MAIPLKFMNEGEKFTLNAHIMRQDVDINGVISSLNIQRVSYFKMGMDSDMILERRILTVTIEIGNRFLWGFLEEMATGGYVPRMWRSISPVENADHAQLLRLNFAARTWEMGTVAIGSVVADFHEIETIVDSVWRFYQSEECQGALNRSEKVNALQVVDDLLQHIQNFRRNIATRNYTSELKRSKL